MLTTLSPAAAASGAAFAIATSFSNTVSTGAVIITVALGITTIVASIFGVKWKATAQASQATIDLWQDNAEGEHVRATNAEADKDRLVATNAELRSRVSELEKLPKLSALESLGLQQLEVLARIESKISPPAP